MIWTAESTAERYRSSGERDVTRRDLHARMQVCQSCEVRIGNRCGMADQIVSVLGRRQHVHCPLLRWPGDVEEFTNWPIEAEPAVINRLAAVTCYFNPCGYHRLLDNYRRFVREFAVFGVELHTIELAFGDRPFELPDRPSIIHVRGNDGNLLWQKEALLNFLIEKLPADIDAVCWIDADLIFHNPHWVEHTKRSLSRLQVVQLFQDCWQEFPDGQLSRIKPSTGYAYAHNSADFTNFGITHPGFAWAGRIDWLREVGLLETHVVGGGDSLMIKGFTNCDLHVDDWINPEWTRTVEDWTGRTFDRVQGAFGYVPGAITHMYHGSRKNRLYNERWRYLTEHDFDPATDVEIDENGLLAWTDSAHLNKPTMIELVRGYFAERREDA